MDKKKYTKKCMLLLNARQFKKLDNNPAKTTEGKIQRMLRKIKPKISEHEYKVVCHQEISTAQLKSIKFPKMVTLIDFQSDLLYQI